MQTKGLSSLLHCPEKKMNHKFRPCLLLLILSYTFCTISPAKTSPLISETFQTLNITSRYPPYPLVHKNRNHQGIGNIRSLLAASLSFIAAAISSAGGIGGGGLFIPILSIIGGQDMKTASAYSTFMVTGGSIANVGKYMLSKRIIDYNIAVLCQPSILLGVSCGVVLNVVFPGWLITLLFVVFVAFCTFKTCKSGILYWTLESRGNGAVQLENDDSGGSTKAPLLSSYTDELDDESKSETPWMAIGMLVIIWFSFFVLYLLRGNRYGQGIIQMEACGTGYWIISSLQIPLAIFFTSWILLRQHNNSNTVASTQQDIGERLISRRSRASSELIFPIMALLAGLLGGVFGIGGGMLISPILLQIGIDPQVTAATCSFMVLVSSSMSALQYLLLGMINSNQIHVALTYAAICFVASLLGFTLIQQAILKHGRPSLIVFSLATVMALSTISMTTFGAIDIWFTYRTGQAMGFNKPC